MPWYNGGKTHKTVCMYILHWRSNVCYFIIYIILVCFYYLLLYFTIHICSNKYFYYIRVAWLVDLIPTMNHLSSPHHSLQSGSMSSSSSHGSTSSLSFIAQELQAPSGNSRKSIPRKLLQLGTPASNHLFSFDFAASHPMQGTLASIYQHPETSASDLQHPYLALTAVSNQLYLYLLLHPQQGTLASIKHQKSHTASPIYLHFIQARNIYCTVIEFLACQYEVIGHCNK